MGLSRIAPAMLVVFALALPGAAPAGAGPSISAAAASASFDEESAIVARATHARPSRVRRAPRRTRRGVRSQTPSGGCALERPLAAGERPPGCWRPYADSSPFNRPIARRPRVHPSSGAIVRRLLGFGPLQNLHAGDAGTPTDHGHPVYFNQPGDPVFTLHCLRSEWGRCSVEGMSVRIPDEALVPGGSDGHLTVVDQASGWEYDFWQVRSKPAGGGRLEFSWGGRTRIDGDGRGSSAVAAKYGTAAGKIRVEELEAKAINHALFIFVKCDSGQFVYPAMKTGRSCSSIGLPDKDAPAMGTRFQLDMTDTQIAALDLPAWRKTILRAMARYGMYVGDTGGTWGLKAESGVVYTSFGLADRWASFARRAGAEWYAPDARWVLNVRDGVDWARHLRVVHPCEAQGTC